MPQESLFRDVSSLPTAEDPVFFQPGTDTPVMMEPVMLCNYLSELGERIGATGAEVYAYHKMDRDPTLIRPSQLRSGCS